MRKKAAIILLLAALIVGLGLASVPFSQPTPSPPLTPSSSPSLTELPEETTPTSTPLTETTAPPQLTPEETQPTQSQPSVEKSEVLPQEELVPITFNFDAPGAEDVSIEFTVFWLEHRREPIPMANEGNSFKATVYLPKNALMRYQYSTSGDAYHGETLSDDKEVNRMVHVAEALTLHDEVYSPDKRNRPIKLHGKLTDQATGEPVIEAIVNIDGVNTMATGDGSYEMQVRAGKHQLIVYLLDGSYKTQSRIVEINGDEEINIELEKAKPAKVRINIDANPPPHHKVRIYSNAEQTGPRQMFYNRFTADGFVEIEGSLELDLHEGQYFEYLYTVGNTMVSYEKKEGWHVARHFTAKDGLVVNDKIGKFTEENHITLNLKVPDYTNPKDIIGVAGVDFGPIFMHRKAENEWVLSIPDTYLGTQYDCFRNIVGEGDEKPTARKLTSRQVSDVVEAWKFQRSEVTPQPFSVPEIKNEFDIFVFLPDLYGSEIARIMDTGIERVAEKGFHGVVLSQIWGPDPIEPNPKLVRTLNTPLYELKRVSKLAHSKGLEVMLYPQFTNIEDGPYTGEEFGYGWWDLYMDELEKFNMYNARAAQAADIEYLLVQSGGPVAMPDSYFPEYNARMKNILTKMRTVYEGKIIAQSEGKIEELDYWHEADIVSQKVADPDFPVITGETPQEKVDEIIANHLDTEYKWMHEQSGKPFLADQLISVTRHEDLEELGSVPASGNELELHWEKQRKVYDAFFKAVNERDWIVGVYLFPYGLTDTPHAIDFNIRSKPAEDLASAWAKRITEIRNQFYSKSWFWRKP